MTSLFWQRPRRWSIRSFLLCFVLFYILYCFAFDMPLFSSKLPQYTGPHGVGVVDIEAPIQEPRRIGNAVLVETGRPAFKIDTVLFSLYYPIERGAKGKADKHLWVPKPLALHAEGYARFAKINSWLTTKVFTFGLWTLVGSSTIPAEVDAQIQGPSRYDEHGGSAGLERYPVIVFSHGMASGRTSYTQYCAELASRGFIVAAIEHRDGSGPGSVINHSDGTTENIFHISASDLNPSPDTPQLKEMQLGMRQAEVEETVKVLRSINSGKGNVIFERNSRGEGSSLSEFEGRLDLEQFVVGGHSYGATLALQALKSAPSAALPFKGGIVLDPGKQSGPLNDDINVPVVIVHSQSWSAKYTIFHGSPHFDVVKNLVEGVMKRTKAAWFLTAKGTTHPSVTDAPLLEPFLLSWTTGATVDVKEGIEQYVKISDDFMLFVKDGRPRGVLEEKVSHTQYNKEIRTITNDGYAKFWQIHVAP